MNVSHAIRMWMIVINSNVDDYYASAAEDPYLPLPRPEIFLHPHIFPRPRPCL